MAKLTLVPTPIGNLADITLRALTVLRAADIIAAEDTRHSRKLLVHHDVDKRLVRLDAHTIRARGEGVLAAHDHVAFITDAGTPGVSDPGAELVQMALARGDSVEVLPGPTALIPALVLSGLSTARFTFEGFLPRKGAARKTRLIAIAQSDATSILYEAPQRLVATLQDLSEVCGDTRPASVSRELSKRFETTYRGTLAELVQMLSRSEVKGEIVIVVAPADATAETDFATQARQFAAEGLTGRELRRALTAVGAPRNVAYELSLQVDGAQE